MAHKKAGSSSKNGRDSVGQRLGVKVGDGQLVPAGSIIVRQRGMTFLAGTGTGLGRDYTVFATVTGAAGLNALTFDAAGNGYVSDSFNGAIWKISSGGGTPSTPWISDPLLGPGTGLTPPFGANGVEFSNDGKTMYPATRQGAA